MPKEIYITSILYEVTIMAVEVVKETEKQYQVDQATVKKVYGKGFGPYVSRNVPKARKGIFFSLEEAQQFCLDALRARLDACRKQSLETLEQIQDLTADMQGEDA